MMRIGLGEDTHRLAPERKLILGGVLIEESGFELGLLGHSDADVLAHSVIDALLGAAALGDIGSHFPDTDAKYKGADSLMLLAHVMEKLNQAGYRVVNTDSVITAQKPKLAPYISMMRENLARVMMVDAGSVSVKATTPEHTGPEGRLECITVRSVALIENCR